MALVCSLYTAKRKAGSLPFIREHKTGAVQNIAEGTVDVRGDQSISRYFNGFDVCIYVARAVRVKYYTLSKGCDQMLK